MEVKPVKAEEHPVKTMGEAVAMYDAALHSVPGLPPRTAALVDGRPILIRPMHPCDAAPEELFLQSLRLEALTRRTDTQVDPILANRPIVFEDRHDVALVAVIPGNGEDRIIGIGRYCIDVGDPASAECSMVILDEWRHERLGTKLMQRLIDNARMRGVRHLYSLDTIDNGTMKEAAADLGFASTPDPLDLRLVVRNLALDPHPD